MAEETRAGGAVAVPAVGDSVRPAETPVLSAVEPGDVVRGSDPIAVAG